MASGGTPSITVMLDEPGAVIRPELYGHFAEHLGGCVDDGLYVGPGSPIPNTNGLRNDVVAALRKIRPPVLRWPGGCHADDYHWEDGVGPVKDRPRRVNLWWGHSIETNGFGTHEFLALCRAIGAEPYLSANVGSGTPRGLRDWMEYCNFDGDSTLARRRAANGSAAPFGVKFWGVGNEAWGCGGHLCPEDYAGLYKRFATFAGDFGGTRPFLIACGPDGNDADWTRRFCSKVFAGRTHFGRRLIHGLGAHYYCGTAGPSATRFNTDEWYELLEKAARMERLILDQRAALNEFDPGRNVGLLVDEWGTWHLDAGAAANERPTPLFQQNTLRDALAAALTLDVFNRQADKVVMANLAQVANVLQAVVLTRGGEMVLTPTYHVFDLYQSHQGGRVVRTEFAAAPPARFAAGGGRRELPGLTGSASLKDDTLTLSVVNVHATLPLEAVIDLRGGGGSAPRREVHVSTLTHDDLTAHNTFDAPDALDPRSEAVEIDAPEWRHTFPPASVTVIHAPIR